MKGKRASDLTKFELSYGGYNQEIKLPAKIYEKSEENAKKTYKTDGSFCLVPTEEKNSFRSYKERKDKDTKKKRTMAPYIIQNHSDLLICLYLP